MLTQRIGLLIAFVAVLGLLGCTAKTDCKALKKRCDNCKTQVFNTLEPGISGPKGWRAEKNKQWFNFCTKIKGRFKESKKINKCLEKKDCKEFASCFCKATKKKGCAKSS